MGIVNPPTGNAVKVGETLPGMGPKTSLQGIGGSAAVADFADITTAIVVEAIDRVSAAGSLVNFHDARRCVQGVLVVKHHDVAALSPLVIY